MYYFISDVHLGCETAEKENKKMADLHRFFNETLKPGDSLFILGDLFDFWFEYKTVIPRTHFETLHVLRGLVLKGVRVEYFMGNHDFWLEDFFPRQLGIPVHQDSMEMDLDGRRYYIGHGDGLAKDDHGYRLLKKILRFPLNVQLYRLLHPALGFGLAHFFSRKSREHEQFPNIDADYVEFALNKISSGCHGVILGHTHRPMLKQTSPGDYLNIGAWMDTRTYGVIEKGKLVLKKWEM